jgi:hypothetical protein
MTRLSRNVVPVAELTKWRDISAAPSTSTFDVSLSRKSLT